MGPGSWLAIGTPTPSQWSAVSALLLPLFCLIALAFGMSGRR